MPRRLNPRGVGASAVALFLLACLVLPVNGNFNINPKVSAPFAIVGPLHSTATDAFVDAAGKRVLLKAVNLQPVWGVGETRTWREANYESIAEQGFNSVRMVVFWNYMEPSRGVFDTTAFAVLDKAIKRASDAGLRIVLDPIHLYGGAGLARIPAWARHGDSVSSIQANAGPYLGYVAARYRDTPAIAGYDLVNEPVRQPIDQNGVLEMYNTLIAQVRRVEPEKILLIEPTFGNSLIDPRFIDFSILRERRNIVWSVHDYFAGDEADGFDDTTGIAKGSYVWNGKAGYPHPSPTQLETHLVVQLDRLREVGLPVWIGEFGIGAHAANRDEWIRDKIDLYQKYNIGYSWWEYWAPQDLSATDRNYQWYPWINLVTGKVS